MFVEALGVTPLASPSRPVKMQKSTGTGPMKVDASEDCLAVSDAVRKTAVAASNLQDNVMSRSITRRPGPAGSSNLSREARLAFSRCPPYYIAMEIKGGV